MQIRIQPKKPFLKLPVPYEELAVIEKNIVKPKIFEETVKNHK